MPTRHMRFAGEAATLHSPPRPSTISPVAVDFTFAQQLAFEPARSAEQLRALPESPGLLALFGHDLASQPSAQPFLTRTANLRRRAQRLLEPPPAREQTSTPDGTPLPSRRLNLRERVGRVAWCATGSEFESLLTLYHATAALFGLADARRRLKLHTPFFLRFAVEHAHPRVYVSNRLAQRSLAQTYGPFPSRLAAERFADAVLDLFKLRRCWEDLVVHPDHPGCAYGEMRRCLAPCNTTCSAEEYAAEAHAVEQFFRTRGESLLTTISAEREQASEEMDFERAAERHRHYEKVRAAVALADELVRPVLDLRAVIVQRAGPARAGSSMADSTTEDSAVADSTTDDNAVAGSPDRAALFLLSAGCLEGPAMLSTLGVRAVREQTAVGSSLFAQPLMLAAIPLAPEPSQPGAPALEALSPNAPEPPVTAHLSPTVTSSEPAFASTHLLTPGPVAMPNPASALSPEDRARSVLAGLERTHQAHAGPPDTALLSDHLALLRRWYYRPEKQRAGELLLPNPDGSWPVRRILNAAARAALGDPKTMQATDREGARTAKTKLIHAGREGVERSVPDLGVAIPKPPRHTPTPSAEAGPAFRSRRSRSRGATATAPAATPESQPAGKLPLP